MRDNPVAGAWYLMRGLGLITRPGVRRYVVVPLLVNVVLFAGAFIYAWRWIEAFIDRTLPDWLAWLEWLIFPLLVLSAAVIVFFTFSMLANLVAAPFNGLLAEAVERHLTGGRPDPGGGWRRFAREAVQSVASEARKLVYVLVRAIPLLFLFIVPVVQVAAPFVWLAFSAWMLAVTYADFPMANHGFAFPEQHRRLRRQRMTGLGFGAAVLAATTIPIVNFLVIPCAVAGATAMWVERLSRQTGEE